MYSKYFFLYKLAKIIISVNTFHKKYLNVLISPIIFLWPVKPISFIESREAWIGKWRINYSTSKIIDFSAATLEWNFGALYSVHIFFGQSTPNDVI